MTDELHMPLVTELTETSGVVGDEGPIRSIIERELADHVDQIQVDAMGNLVATINPGADAAVVIGAHMDEIGFMVRHIDDDGFLTLDALGGWDASTLRAQRVRVHTASGTMPGVIGAVPPHTKSDDDAKAPKLTDLRVDMGLDADRVEDTVAVGDLVSLEQRTVVLGEYLTGKALDDRICVYALLAVAAAIEDPAVTVHLAFTVQEEVGLRGAEALGVDIDPMVALALDTTVANDIPGIDSGQAVTRLGAGVALKLKDGSVVTSPAVRRQLQTIADAEEIALQYEVLPRGGTDTARFQRTHGATPVGALSVPTRYLHTATEVASPADVRALIDLVVAFVTAAAPDDNYGL
jgi:Cellulase M and related proteins